MDSLEHAGLTLEVQFRIKLVNSLLVYYVLLLNATLTRSSEVRGKATPISSISCPPACNIIGHSSLENNHSVLREGKTWQVLPSYFAIIV